VSSNASPVVSSALPLAQTEAELLRLVLDLGAADDLAGLSAAELNLADASVALPATPRAVIDDVRALIDSGQDPLGDTFCQLRTADTRRGDGAFYTPPALVEPMIAWVTAEQPERVVDAGCGSGRFAAAVARANPDVALVAVDLDPFATLMTRAHLHAVKARNFTVVQGDYTRLDLPAWDGRTAFIGNPPYVRHHQLTPQAKAWARAAAEKLGHSISGLAGLHALFFLATAAHGKPGDVGCFVTSSEWLDVNYGAIIRALLLKELGGHSIHVIEPEALPFSDATTTAAITTFRLGDQPDSVRLRKVSAASELAPLADVGQPVLRRRLEEANRWSVFLRPAEHVPDGFVELGELCRVHRGTVTGSNETWILDHTADLPDSVLLPSITRARELFAAGDRLTDSSRLKRVADIPAELEELDSADLKLVKRFIAAAKKAGVHRGYIASHRKAWWSLGMKEPAPILATYMARRPPAFVLNDVDARHVNIAHGVYPREALDDHTTARLALALRAAAQRSSSRVYAGGLMKWEPKEMERLMVPTLATLRSHVDLTAALEPVGVR
jgi:adenine-specific DNA-methyltransferase